MTTTTPRPEAVPSRSEPSSVPWPRRVLRPAGSAPRRTIGEGYAASRNSLNFLRLVFAVTVIVSHAIGWGLFGSDEMVGKSTWGTMAVFGFFGISGYLIAASAVKNSFGRYLWQRFLRIFPGFWVCLLVTVFVFGAMGFARAPHPRSCHAACYVGQIAVPYLFHHGFFRYVDLHTLALSNVFNWSIHGTLGANGVPVTNDPLWTLFYEFLCYLAVGALARTGVIRHRLVVLCMTAALWLGEIVVALRPHAGIGFDGLSIITLFPVFFTGSLVYLYRDELVDSGLLALACGALVVGSFWMPFGVLVHRPTSVDVFAPLMAYAVLWLGLHLPFHRVGARNDYSYGFYIYGLPVTELWSWLGLARHGFLLFALLSVAGTAPLAVASWWLVERRCLRLKKLRWAEVTGFVSGLARSVGSTGTLTGRAAAGGE